MKVQIFEIIGIQCNECQKSPELLSCSEGWQEVDQEELNYLKYWVSRQAYGSYVVIVQDSAPPVEKIISDVKGWIKQQKDEQERAAKAEAEKKRIRDEKKTMKGLRDKKELLEKLKKELGESE